MPKNSGGVTHSKDPTVLGHTTPGASVFTGTGTLDLKLRGPAVVADANGNFSLKVDLTDGINQLDFQAVDPYGRQTLRASRSTGSILPGMRTPTPQRREGGGGRARLDDARTIYPGSSRKEASVQRVGLAKARNAWGRGQWMRPFMRSVTTTASCSSAATFAAIRPWAWSSR